MKQFLFTILFICATTASAAELVHQFNSPAFSGIGYSTHVLTIEQLEANRKQKIKDDEQAVIDKADRDYKSTNAYKFKNNLESRVYATLSKQIADSMFGETSAWVELTEYGAGTVITYNGKQYKSTTNINTTTPGAVGANWVLTDSDWATSQTPFGDVVSWKREDDRIYVQVKDSNGDTVAEFDVPVGEFAF
jgi:hypothetical protein